MILLKTLITGASGFVGTYLTTTLKKNNIEVLGISRSISSVDGESTDTSNCDILNKPALKEILSSYRPDYIVHLAAPAFIPDSFHEPQKTYNIIFQGTLNLLECIRELDLQTKLLYISSADVYGNGSKSVLSESEPYDPINPYSCAKACAELLCRQFHKSYGLNVVIARPFNHTGPGQSTDFVCSSFAHQIASLKVEQEKILFTGNIDVKRDFLDVRDVVEAYYHLLKSGVQGEIYNVCSGTATSLREIIQTLFKQANIEKYEIIIDPKKVREKDVPIRVGDNSKIKNFTGWNPKYTIEKTVLDIFDYWKEYLHE